MLRVCVLCLLCFIYDALGTVPPIPPGLTGTLLDEELLSAEPRSGRHRIPRDANQRWIHRVEDFARAQMVSQPSLLSPFRLDLPLAGSDESLPVLVLPVPVFGGSCTDKTVDYRKLEYPNRLSNGNTYGVNQLNSHANTKNVPNKSLDTENNLMYKMTGPNVEDSDDDRNYSNSNTNTKQVTSPKLFTPQSVYEQDEEDYVGPHQYHFSSPITSEPVAPSAHVNHTQETKFHIGPDSEDDNKTSNFQDSHPNNENVYGVNKFNAPNNNHDNMFAPSPSINFLKAQSHTPKLLSVPNVKERDNYHNKWNGYMGLLPTREVATTRRSQLQYAPPNIKYHVGPDDRDDYSPPLLFLPPKTSPAPMTLTTSHNNNLSQTVRPPLPYAIAVTK